MMQFSLTTIIETVYPAPVKVFSFRVGNVGNDKITLEVQVQIMGELSPHTALVQIIK